MRPFWTFLDAVCLFIVRRVVIQHHSLNILVSHFPVLFTLVVSKIYQLLILFSTQLHLELKADLSFTINLLILIFREEQRVFTSVMLNIGTNAILWVCQSDILVEFVTVFDIFKFYQMAFFSWIVGEKVQPSFVTIVTVIKWSSSDLHKVSDDRYFR